MPTPAKAPPRTIDDIAKLLDHYKLNPEIAAQAAQTADAEPPEKAERSTLFEFYNKRSQAAATIGRVRQQIEDLQKAVAHGNSGDEETLRALMQLSSAQSTTGNLLDAIRTAETLLTQVPRNLSGLSLLADSLLTYQYSQIGDFGSARRHLSNAETTYAKLRHAPGWRSFGKQWTATIERARSDIFSAEGNLPAAEQSLRRAIQAFEEAIAERTYRDTGVKNANIRFLEILQRSLAKILLQRGQIVEAETLARNALKSTLERVGRSSTDTGIGLNLLSRIIAEQGRYAEAAKLGEEALKAYESAGAQPESLSVIFTRKHYGATLAAQGRYLEALRIFNLNTHVQQQNPELVRRIGIGDVDWILALLRTGDTEGAEQLATRMHTFATQRFGENALRTQEIQAFLAMATAKKGDLLKAKSLFESAVPPLIAQARSASESEASSLRRQQRLAIILESYIHVLSELGKQPEHTVDTTEESFRLAEIARSSSVQRAMTASAARATIHDPKLAALARQEQDAQRRIATLSELLLQLISAPPTQQLPQIQASVSVDIVTLKAETLRLKSEIEQSFPDYANLVDPKPVTAGEARKTLKPGEVLLSYYLGEDRSYVWVVGTAGPTAFAIIPKSRSAIAGDIARLRAALDPQVASIDALPAFDLALAHQLYQNLLGPIESHLANASQVLLVAHGELGQLPLSLLTTTPTAPQPKTSIPFDSYRNAPWLIRKFAIEQLPSVTSLVSLRKLPPGDPARRSFIGFGDPLFSQQQADQPLKQITSPTMRGAPLQLRSMPHTFSLDSAELALLPRLPDTGDEIREIARALKASPEDIFLQMKASEQSVMETDLAQRKVIMFATHGLIPGELNGLTQPALALTAPELVNGKGNGLLEMDEILSLKLNADWVVLSACNTGVGDGAGAEAVSGLGRAFFYAGTRALLVSNWPVETSAARMLMTSLFRLQSENPLLTKAAALQQAMLELADGPGKIDPKNGKTIHAYAHPLFWAPFMIVGD
jgi:CHAT domain-containing protein